MKPCLEKIVMALQMSLISNNVENKINNNKIVYQKSQTVKIKLKMKMEVKVKMTTFQNK